MTERLRKRAALLALDPVAPLELRVRAIPVANGLAESMSHNAKFDQEAFTLDEVEDFLRGTDPTEHEPGQSDSLEAWVRAERSNDVLGLRV